MKQLFKIFYIFSPSQLRWCIFIFLLMIVGAVLEAFGIGLIFPLISLMENTDFLSQHNNIAHIVSTLGIKNHTDFVSIATVGLIFFFLIKNLFIGFEYKIQIYYTIKLQSFFMNRLLESYLSKPYEFFLINNPALVQRNILASSSNVFLGLLIPTLQLLTELITSIVIGGMILFIDFYTASVLGIVVTVVLYVMLKSLRKKISRCGVYQTKYAEIMYKWINQAIGAVKETKVLRKEKFFLNSFSEACSVYCSSLRTYNFINQLPRLFIESLAVISLLGFILVKLFLGNKPMDIVPFMGLLALSAFRIMPSVNRIIVTYNSIKFQLPNLDILFDEFIRIKEQHSDNNHLFNVTEKKLKFKDKIVIKNIEYAYPSSEDSKNIRDKLVLKNISFVIPKGKFVGIIGPSGSGKTTFVDVLLGLLSPTAGNIYVDGIDVRSDIRGWQANIAYVPQTIYLIDGTIKENIALGNKECDIDENKINKVLEMAELSEFVKNLPKGIYTDVGDRGVRLSGGQRQRIGIARALYLNPEILILDEATSALDSDTERSIMQTILKLKGIITIVSIAHRTSTLEECDFKVNFQKGLATIM